MKFYIILHDKNSSMTKYILFFFGLLLLTITGNAKEKNKDSNGNDICSHQGNFSISLGYGFPSIIRTYLKQKTNRDQLGVHGAGPYLLKADYKIRNKWSIGFSAAYNKTRLSWMDDGYDPAILGNRPYEYGIKASEISATLRGNYHYLLKKKIDAYTGFGFGYSKVSLQTYTLAPYNQFAVRYDFPRPYTFELTTGMRYYFTKNIGLYTELGIGKAWLLFNKYFVPEAVIQGGVNIKF